MFIVQNDLEQTLNDSDISIMLEDSKTLATIQNRAISEVKSYIQHRYDPDEVFLDINVFSLDATYAIGDYVFYTEDDWSTSKAYETGNRVYYNGIIYEAAQGSTGETPEDNITYWTVITSNSFFTCTAESTGNYPEDTDYFTDLTSDPRDFGILDITCIITIYYLFRKVQPRNIPEWISNEYERVKDDLKAYQRGIRMIDLTVRTGADGEEEGHRITYGSQTAKNWSF